MKKINILPNIQEKTLSLPSEMKKYAMATILGITTIAGLTSCTTKNYNRKPSMVTDKNCNEVSSYMEFYNVICRINENSNTTNKYSNTKSNKNNNIVIDFSKPNSIVSKNFLTELDVFIKTFGLEELNDTELKEYIKTFQRVYGLKVDGIYGEETSKKFEIIDKENFKNYLISIDNVGEEEIKDFLDFYEINNIGNFTEKVKSFQADKGLKINGIINFNTKEKFHSEKNAMIISNKKNYTFNKFIKEKRKIHDLVVRIGGEEEYNKTMIKAGIDWDINTDIYKLGPQELENMKESIKEFQKDFNKFLEEDYVGDLKYINYRRKYKDIFGLKPLTVDGYLGTETSIAISYVYQRSDFENLRKQKK